MVYSREGMLPIHKALLFGRSDVVKLFLEIDETIAQFPYRDIPITHLAIGLAGSTTKLLLYS